jgi:Raf kinase inhibitor-like YbhB/YbcL family protein
MDRMLMLMSVIVIAASVAAVLTAAGCDKEPEEKPEAEQSAEGGFTLTSPDFKEGAMIPAEFTGDGEDVSPALAWQNPPPGTVSFALIVDDPDAPGGAWTHWLVCGIAGASTSLPRAAQGMVEGKNDFRSASYGGPAPPPGKPHRYYFRLYALDTTPALKQGFGRRDLGAAIEGHVLGQAQLMGRYGR